MLPLFDEIFYALMVVANYSMLTDQIEQVEFVSPILLLREQQYL